MIVELNSKVYRVSYDNTVEVFIPRGEPRAMELWPRAAYWRTLKPGSRVTTKVLAEHKAGLQRIANDWNHRGDR